MGNVVIHDMNTAWTSSDPSRLQVAVDSHRYYGPDATSNRLVAEPGAQGTTATFIPNTPLNLSDFEEIRFWISSDRGVGGSLEKPFYLEFSYTDDGDAQGEVHRWLIPLNRPDTWELRRIGIQDDRRSAISSLQWRCLTNLSFVCHLDGLLAVRADMLVDLEQSLTVHLDRQPILPDLIDIPLSVTANPGDALVVLPLNRGFHANNRVRLQSDSDTGESHLVDGVDHDTAAGQTRLNLTEAVTETYAAGTATVSVLVPVIFEIPPADLPAPSPAIVFTQLGVREDGERTGYVAQRDSFRPRGDLVVCSMRPAARLFG